MTSIAPAPPDIVPILEKNEHILWHMDTATKCENTFLYSWEYHQRQFVFSLYGQQYPFTIVPQGYINRPGL